MKKILLCLSLLLAVKALMATDQFNTITSDTSVIFTLQGAQITLKTTQTEVLGDYQSEFKFSAEEWREIYENEILTRKTEQNILSHIFPPRIIIILEINSYYPEDGIIQEYTELIIGKEKYNTWYLWCIIILPLAVFLYAAWYTRKESWRFLLIFQIITIGIIVFTLIISWLNYVSLSMIMGLIFCLIPIYVGISNKGKYRAYALFFFLAPAILDLPYTMHNSIIYGQDTTVYWYYLLVLAGFAGIGWSFRIFLRVLSAFRRNQEAKKKILS